MKRKPYLLFLFLILLLAACILFSMCAGSAGIPVLDAVYAVLGGIPLVNRFFPCNDLSPVTITIIRLIRLPRIFLALLTGGALAMCGAVMQNIFRNPLADPHILGVSSGAALGATIAIVSGITINAFGLGTISLFAFAGSIITIILVCGMTSIGSGFSSTVILLGGTAVSTLFSSLISLIMTLNHNNIEQVYMWTLGSFNTADMTSVTYLAIVCLIVFIIIMIYSDQLDLMAMDEDTARNLGVNTQVLRLILIIAVSVLIAVCVSVSGIIGFVGLIIPHCVRRITTGKCRILIPACFLFGASFLLISDTIARTIIMPSELPVGVVTAIIGAPYFIYMIRRKHHG